MDTFDKTRREALVEIGRANSALALHDGEDFTRRVKAVRAEYLEHVQYDRANSHTWLRIAREARQIADEIEARLDAED